MSYDTFFETLVASAVKAYIEVYGQDRWDRLTEAEKNTAVHAIVMDFAKACLQ